MLLSAFVLLAVIANAQKAFEGEIKYRNFENHSKQVRKQSRGLQYNGVRNVRVVVKGNKMLLCDESMHLNTLMLPDDDLIIIYNDLMKKGLAYNYSTYKSTYMSALDPNKSVAMGERQYNVGKTTATQTFGKEKCNNYKGTITSSVSSMAKIDISVDVWTATKYKMPDAYRCYLYGLDVPGIAMKWTFNQQAKVPIIGRMDSFVASEVKELIPRAVSDSELSVPDDVTITETDSAGKLLSIYKDTRNYLKSQNMYPGDADADTDVTYSIEEEWNF